MPSTGAVPLIGRDQELAALEAVVDRVRHRNAGPRLVVLRGDPGVGKSALLRAVAEAAAANGCRVLAGRAEDLDGRLPYAL
ncbi:MAG TPA: ATP-binding protein, partial [Actinomycetes bacterium]|nr:ATP-binding protein [Actinomycetes bacterium]